MKLSIIIISYNEKLFLDEAIISCLNQDYNDYEIIIGDDGSDDGSIDVIKSYIVKNNNIKHFVMERNSKYYIPSIRVSNIIKKALSIASGEYVCVLSGDDFFVDSQRFKEHVEFLDTHSSYSAVISKYEEYYERSKSFRNAGTYCNNRKLFWSGMYAHISCFTFRKKIFDEGLLLEKMCDDTGLIYSIALDGKWYNLSTVAMAYRQRDGSIMHKADKLELAIIEMMLMQDVLNKNKLLCSSLARFYRSYSYCRRHHKELNEKKYHKYLESCDGYNHNVLKEIIDSNKNYILKLKLNFLQFISLLCFIYYGCIRKIYRYLNYSK